MTRAEVLTENFEAVMDRVKEHLRNRDMKSAQETLIVAAKTLQDLRIEETWVEPGDFLTVNPEK